MIEVCDSCHSEKDSTEFYAPGVQHGKIPPVCYDCRALRPDEAWCAGHGEWHAREEFSKSGSSRAAPGALLGVCKRIRAEQALARRGKQRQRRCAWCNEMRTLAQMRYPWQKNGKTPPICQACRDAHPGMAWCTFHAEPHPIDQFSRYSSGERAGRLIADCRAALSESASERRGHDPISCAWCKVAYPSHQFRGGRHKSAVCRSCESNHPGLSFCRACAQWLALEHFTRNGPYQKPLPRCKPCHVANLHGTTVQAILDRQGAVEPECAVCGARDDLKIDHDHAHCPAEVGCPDCVRGYLCHACNTAEGLLRTPERVESLARYMRRALGVS